MNLLKQVKAGLAKKREAQGALSGSTLRVGAFTVKVEHVIGEGGFATIYLVTDCTTGARFALKHFRLSGDPDAIRDVQTEVAVMRALAHCPHVLRLQAAGFAGPQGSEEDAYLLVDLCDSSLASFLQARSFQLDTATVLAVFTPVARAIEAMHCLDPPLAHRDCKAENVLLHSSGAWVLCDFGSATSRQKVYETPREIAWEEEAVRRQTTPAYRAPELWDLYSREVVGVQVDVWALGVLLYFLCFGKLPFDGEAKLSILNGRYSMPEGQRRPEALIALIQAMLVVSPAERATIAEVTRRLEQLQEGAPAGRAAAMHARAPSMGWSTLAASRDPAAAGDAPNAAPETLTSSSPDGWASFSSPKQSFKAAEPPQEEQWGGLDVAGPLAAGPSGRDVLSSHPSRSQRSETAAELCSLSAGNESGSELEQARQRISQLEQHAQALEGIVEERAAVVAALEARFVQQAGELAEAQAARGQGELALAAEVAALREQKAALERQQAAHEGEVAALRQQVQAQAQELQQLRVRLQAATAAQPAAATLPSAAPALQVDVAADNGGAWVDFQAGASNGNAPTPTLLQPQAARPWQAAAQPAAAMALDSLLQSSLELGGGGRGRSSSSISRSGSMNGSRPPSRAGSGGPSSFPLELTPTGRNTDSPGHSSSPPKSRLGRPGSPGRQQQQRTLSGRPHSPSKSDHRRHLSEPFFSDLNPF